ncbi:hypothetical protein NXS19_011121 [Fusarium pseudograminearum]|nr:hypothetical protein NXS19_011121 [Fusarium pseudograminearum]
MHALTTVFQDKLCTRHLVEEIVFHLEIRIVLSLANDPQISRWFISLSNSLLDWKNGRDREARDGPPCARRNLF